MCCCGEDNESCTNEKTPIKPSRQRRRSCTDCLCLIIFGIFVCGMIVITALTVLDQGFARLQFGYDSEGNICGNVNRPRTKNQNEKLNLNDKKYVLFFDYLKPKTSKKVCVQSCPTKTLHSEAEYKEYSRQTNTSLCFYSLGTGEYNQDLCPSFPIYES